MTTEKTEDVVLKETTQDVVLDNDIRRITFWKNYLKPKSETFGNAYQSALKAGYAETYARGITTEPMFKRKMRHMQLYQKAERVLEEALDTVSVDENGKVDAAVLRVKTDTAKHVTKNLGKDDGWTERVETTGKDGTPIIVMPAELMKKYDLNDLKEVDTKEEVKEDIKEDEKD